jgi:hypothetical protein
VNGRFESAIARFDEENSKDPNFETHGLERTPRELFYAQRLTEWVLKLEPNASEVLLLAARSQHICRWQIPRGKHSADRAGYHRWRNELKQFHAEIAGRILHECGYDDQTIAQVRRLNLKENFPSDPESRTLENALCLVFLQFQFHDFAAKTDKGKVLNALRKSWSKMTERGRKLALTLPFSDLDRELLSEALGAGKAQANP